jgi:hypothetical protein
MKTRAALALSVTGILVTGSAALTVNTHVLNTTPAGTGNANRILLPSNTGNALAPAAAISVKAVPNLTPGVDGGTTAPAPAPARTVGKPESGDHKGGRKTGSVTKKSDARPAKSQPAGTAAFQPDAGPTGSPPDSTAGSQTNASPAVVSVQASDDKGGLGTAIEPGDDKAKQRNSSEPGDDSGGHGSDD